MSVFCEDCKYHKRGPAHTCRKSYSWSHTCIRMWKVWPQCHDKNKDNNCPHYKRKRWKFWVKEK